MIAGKFHTESMPAGVSWQTFSYGSDARYMSTGIDYAYKCNSGDTITNKGGIRVTRTNGGNPLSWADNTDKFIKTFSYDNQGRLASADIPGISRTNYGYNWVGSRTSPTAIFNDADQLTSYNGNIYTYNTEGTIASGAGRTYTYANSGLLHSVSDGSVTCTYDFDPHGYQVMFNNGSNSAKYVYDMEATIPAMIAEGPIDGSTTAFYVREPGGELVMRKAGEDQKYYHFDEQGNTLFLTDASGVQTDKYVYGSEGTIVSRQGTTNNSSLKRGRYGYETQSVVGNTVSSWGSKLSIAGLPNNGRAYMTGASGFMCGDARAPYSEPPSAHVNETCTFSDN